MTALQQIVEAAWDNNDLLKEQNTIDAIKKVVAFLDAGDLRVAEPKGNTWQVNTWVKKAVVLYFPISIKKRIQREGNKSSAACGCPPWGLHSSGYYSHAQLRKHRSLCG